MKLIKKLLAMMLALCCVVAITACDETSEEYDTNKTGIALEYRVAEEDGKGFASITGLFLSDKEKDSLTKITFKASYELVISDKIEVVTYDEDGNVKYDENDKLVTEFIEIGKEYDGIKVESFKIADAAFANQTIVKSANIGSTVESIGAGAFAGCSNLKSMVLPFVGETAGNNVNAKKTFGYIFGTAEAAGCTSVTSNYNTSGSLTSYIPSSLTEVTVNYAEGSVLPEYAFNKVTTLEKVVLTGVVGIGKNAFEGCSSLYAVNGVENVTEIGKNAFASCSNLIGIDLSNVTVIYQSAFSGCSKLGYKATEALDLTGVTIYEKAFASCTSLTSIKLDSLNLSGAVFSGCSSLENVIVGETTYAKDAWSFDDNGNIVAKQ